jgi:splicing factor 3B subunit 2
MQDDMFRMQRDSMSEHEKEMQRQMLSVPGTTQIDLMPPPNFGTGPPGSSSWSAERDEQVSEDLAKKLPSLMSLKIDKPDNQNDEDEKSKGDLVLPKALEDALAMKALRALELGDEVSGSDSRQSQRNTTVISSEYADGDIDSDDDLGDLLHLPPPPTISKAQGRLDKNRRKKKRKKQNRKHRNQQLAQNGANDSQLSVDADEKMDDKQSDEEKSSSKKEEENVEIEYVPEKITITELAPMYRQFYRVFELFKVENKPKEIVVANNDASESSRMSNDRNS